MSEFDLCTFLYHRWRNLIRWRNLWTILLFIFGATVVIFLVGAVLLFIREDWLPGALATLGTIVNGVGIKWVLDRRNEAVAEEGDAKNDLLNHCGKKIAAEGVRAMELAEAPKRGAAETADNAALTAIEDKYKLFGLFR